MLVLGIESTAHTLGIGIVRDEEILANEKKMLFESGIHPRKTADHHANEFAGILKSALEKANVKLKEIDRIAFSIGPGLGPCLRISSAAARALGLKLKKPVFGINHCVAHIEISKLFTKTKDPLILYVSGGNTQIIVKEGKKYRIIGETLDIGIGNMLDVFARDIGENGAKEVEQIALRGTRYIQLPYTVKGMDVAFSGILTHTMRLKGKHKKEDLCFSLQETSYSMLCEATERALALTKKNEVIVCGGVAQSKRLEKMLQQMSDEWNVKFGVAPREYNADNGAMIAYTATLLDENRQIPIQECNPNPRYRTDQFEI